MSTSNTVVDRVRWKTVIVPIEHGGWGFLLEPVLLGLLLAPTWAGLLLGLAALAVFLIRHPLKLLLMDRRKGLISERTNRARIVIAILAVLACLAFVSAFWLSGPAFLAPLALAIPFGAVYLYSDLIGPPRTLRSELMGPLTLAFMASSIVVMEGWAMLPALALWVALGLRSVPSVLYVRVRIQLDRGRGPNTVWPIIMHIVALAIAAFLVWTHLLPALSLLAYTALLARAVLFLSPRRPRRPVKTIGFMELGMGIFLVLTIAVGYAV